MFRIILILVSLVVLVLSQNRTFPPPQCDPTYYANRDETCDGNLRRCKWFYTCKGGKCVYGNIGADCTAKEDCFGWREESLRCVNNKCVKPKYPGYRCGDSGECFTGQCTNGVCTGKKVNEPCEASRFAECDYGYYCSLTQKKCVPQLKLLDSCNDYVVQDDIPQGANYNIMCPGGSVCMGRTGNQVCRPYRDTDIGGACNADRNGDEECKFGLRCSRSKNICIVPNLDQPTYACVGSRNCSFVAGETCVCNEGTTTAGTCRTRTDRVKCDMISAQNKYRQCMTDSNCPYEKNFLFSWLTDTLDGKTCLGQNCGKIARDYLCCALPAYRREKWSQASSGVLGCDSGAGQAVGIVFLVLFLLCLAGCIVAGIIGGIVFMIRRRQQAQYESVY